MPRHILIKWSNIKYKEKLLKAAREKQQIRYKGIPIRLTADLSAETLQARGSGRTYLKWWKGKTKTKQTNKQLPTNNNLLGQDIIQNWRIKSVPDSQSRRVHHHWTDLTIYI